MKTLLHKEMFDESLIIQQTIEDLCCCVDILVHEDASPNNGSFLSSFKSTLPFKRNDKESRAFDSKLAQLQAESVKINEDLKSQVLLLNEEKNSIVMKYAQTEKMALECKRLLKCSKEENKALMKENASLEMKFDDVKKQVNHISLKFQQKNKENTQLHEEIQKLKIELRSQNLTNKWTMDKVNMEREGHDATRVKLLLESNTVETLQSDILKIKQDFSELNKNILKLRNVNGDPTTQDEFKLHRQILEVSKSKYQSSIADTFDSLQKNYLENMNSFEDYNFKIGTMERECLSKAKNIDILNQTLLDAESQIEILNKMIQEKDKSQSQLQEKLSNQSLIQCRYDEVVKSLESCEKDLEACRKNEAELLQFTSKISDSNTQLMLENKELSELNASLNSNAVYQENEALKQEKSCLAEKVSKLEESERYITTLNQSLQIENTEFALRELTQYKDLLSKEKKKCEVNRRDLTKQLKAVNKRCEELSASVALASSAAGLRGSLASCNGTSSLSKNQSASLCNSLESFDSFSQLKIHSSHNNGILSPLSNDYPFHSKKSSTDSSQLFDINSEFVDDFKVTIAGQTVDAKGIVDIQPILIEKIVKLQRIIAKKNEKLDFINSHVLNLQEEISKKTRVIQNFLLSENCGALSSNDMDRNKKVLIQKGGIMAALFSGSSQLVDKSMTLELSLKINQKLQTLLEDLLLKNIILKENLDTLSTEISHEFISRSKGINDLK